MKILSLLFYFTAMLSAIGNAYSLYSGEIDKPVLGWCVSAALFFAIVLDKAKDISDT